MKSKLLFLLYFSGITAFTNAQNLKTVKIGSQVWMAENLNVSIPGSWYYNDDPKLGRKYGRLYTWEAAQKACPSGFHLPSDHEWLQLIDALGGEDKAGAQMRMGGPSGFNAFLAGLTSIGNFRLLDTYGTFWSSSSFDKDHAWYFYLTSGGPNVTRTYFAKDYGLSVRCVKNK